MLLPQGRGGTGSKDAGKRSASVRAGSRFAASVVRATVATAEGGAEHRPLLRVTLTLHAASAYQPRHKKAAETPLSVGSQTEGVSDREPSGVMGSARLVWLSLHVRLAFLTNFECSCSLMGLFTTLSSGRSVLGGLLLGGRRAGGPASEPGTG